jgi:hypothetical protein
MLIGFQSIPVFMKDFLTEILEQLPAYYALFIMKFPAPFSFTAAKEISKGRG